MASKMAKLTLTVDEKVMELLIRLRDTLDELIDLIEVESDEQLKARLDEGLRDVTEGRVRPLEEFLRELGERGSA